MKKTPRIFQRPVQYREGARPRTPRWPAALLAACFVLLPCAMSAAFAADLALDGRWLDAASNAVANATVPATVKVYTNDAPGAVALTNAPVTLATDADGFFRTVATNLALPAECRTFWLGVTPDGGTEIAPRMRVSPAPYALRAAEASLLDTDRLTVEGTVVIGRLTNQTATVGAVYVSDELSLLGGLAGNGTLYLDGIDLSAGGGARLALFRKMWTGVAQSGEGASISENYDAIVCSRLQDHNSLLPVVFLKTTDILIEGRGQASQRNFFITIPVRHNASFGSHEPLFIFANGNIETTLYYGGVE